MSGRAFLLILLVVLLVLIGLGTITGGVIALALPLCVYLAAGIFFNPAAPKLSADRTLSTTSIFPGTPVIVKVSVRNNGAAIEEIHITDNVPEGLEVTDGVTEMFTSLASGEEVSLEYTTLAGRGDHRFTNLQVVVREGFGLFEHKLTLPAAHRLTVRPQPTRLKSIRIRPPQTRGFAGPIPSRQGGVGVDFFLVREYQPGDPQRRVNWKVAAHGGNELYTNIYEQERVADVGIILDSREQCYGDLANHPLFERAVQATASLAEGFLNEGNRVGLLVYGGGIDSAFPGVGKVQRMRILQVLARAHTGRNYALETLRYLPTRFFPPRSQVVLISPLVHADIEILIGLRSQAYSVLVISPDIVRYNAGTVDAETRDHRALRLALAERALMLQKFRRAGVQVIDWDVNLPFENLAHRYAVMRLAANQYAEIPS
jgi:uncharacterized protein (DUF58 family)